MTAKFKQVFGETKPVIGMVHLPALPGTPLFDPAVDILATARANLIALQEAGFDAVMFGNENDRPYEFAVDPASTATMAAVIGQLRPEITVPFGVNVLWDPMASIALGAATVSCRTPVLAITGTSGTTALTASRSESAAASPVIWPETSTASGIEENTALRARSARLR